MLVSGCKKSGDAFKVENSTVTDKDVYQEYKEIVKTHNFDDEENKERMYTEKNIRAYLKEAGFEKIYCFGDMNFSDADEEVTDRLHFVAVK